MIRKIWHGARILIDGIDVGGECGTTELECEVFFEARQKTSGKERRAAGVKTRLTHRGYGKAREMSFGSCEIAVKADRYYSLTAHEAHIRKEGEHAGFDWIGIEASSSQAIKEK